jgi:hypothetical protein
VFAPEGFIELGKVLEQLPGRLAFEILSHLGDRNLWWHRYKKMDMVFRDVSFDDLDLVRVTNFSDEISGSSTKTARQHGFFVLGGPYEMILAIVGSMRTTSV